VQIENIFSIYRDPSAELLGKLMFWASTGKVPIHREISWEEIKMGETLYESPICEVRTGKSKKN
jgi:hypothetical protein